MRHYISLLLAFALFFATQLGAQTQITTIQNKKEFFNGDENHIYDYFDRQAQNLDRLEGVWTFTKIEYDEYGMEVYNAPSGKSAIIRTSGERHRAFIEVNLTRDGCAKYRVIYNIQTGGGSVYYPTEPVGCMVPSGRYTFDPVNYTISRDAVPLFGTKAVLIGVRIYPQGATGGSGNNGSGFVMPSSRQEAPRPSPGMVAPRKDRSITDPDGWEPFIDWGKQIFPSYLVSTATLDASFSKPDKNYLGDQMNVVGVAVNSPRSGAKIKIEIDSTRYFAALSEEFTLPKRGERYTIFPKVAWDYESLYCIRQAFPMAITYRVTLNGKTTTETVNATMRAIDDCPINAYDYRGELIDLRAIFAAYVNENNPKLEDIRKDILKKGTVKAFAGYQGGEALVYQQVYAFWKYLREKGTKYSSITDNGYNEHPEVFSQRVRLLEDVIDSDQANCIDGTAIFASCLKSVGIDPIIVVVPGHAFLGYYVDAEHTSYRFLETTLVGDEGASPACSLPDPAFLDNITKALKPTDNSDKIARFVSATCYGIDEFLKKQHEATLIDLQTCRKLVKPLRRCTDSKVVQQPPPEQDFLDKKISRTVPRTGQKSPVVSTSVAPSTGKPKGQTGNGDKPTAAANKPTPAPLPKPKPAWDDVAKKPSAFRGIASYDSLAFSTSAPAKSGTYYKVHLEWVSQYEPDNPIYTEMTRAGYRIDVEYVAERKRYRIMAGDFSTEEAALPAAHKAQQLFEAQKVSDKTPNTKMLDVGIAIYRDGNRGIVKYRDWSLLYTPPKKVSEKKD